MEAGEFSAAKIGTVDPFTPIPSPRTRREARSAETFTNQKPGIRGEFAVYQEVNIIELTAPGFSETGRDGSGDQTEGSEEDDVPSTEVKVERVRDPTSTTLPPRDS